MTFWQENFAFIKDVYDQRAAKLIDLMDKTDKSMDAVKADKIYTSNEFKKVKEVFAGLARNLEQPETKEWLMVTKDTLMSDREGKNDADDETKKLKALLDRYDEIIPKVQDTRNVVDCLWKAYQFTDELAPFMEWMEDMRSKSTRDINTNSSAETEEHIEKQEKYLDQMDKKRKSVNEQIAKGEKILTDPKSPKFLEGHVQKLKSLWEDANKCAEDRLAALKENLTNWERYEKNRDGLTNKLNDADKEFEDQIKEFAITKCDGHLTNHAQITAKMRTDIEDTFKTVADSNAILAKLMGDCKKAELADEVENLKNRMNILNTMDDRLKFLEEFNKRLKAFENVLKEFEAWDVQGRKRMDDLLKPDNPILPEERVMYTMELQGDVQQQIEKHGKHNEEWNQIRPDNSREETEDAEGFVKRMGEVIDFLNKLLAEVKSEGEKFGEDIKYLADFTGGCKKFEPWIATSEAKKASGMKKPGNLQEALDLLAATKTWKDESTNMKGILQSAKDSAAKMTVHDDPDKKHAAYVKRWEVIDATCDDWTKQLQAMVDVWQKQAETAAKVTEAMANPAAGEMKLEDLEKHLENLKQMFIEKQKMMSQLEASKEGGGAPPPAPAPAPEAAPPAPAQ